MDIIPLFPSSQTSSSGIIIDEHWIDTTRLKSWIHFCDSNHGGTCTGFQDRGGIGDAISLLLIDMVAECLVEAPVTERYFALSYVWGKPDPNAFVLETTVENLANRLCIVQNDKVHKARQIDAMGSIYSNAYCTIIAACGEDSHSGLPGVGNGSKPRSFLQSVLDFSIIGTQCLVLPKAWSTERSSVWNTRGWTFQEKIMSRRSLVFGPGPVTWRCQRCTWREDTTGDVEGTPRPLLGESLLDTFKQDPWPNLHAWMHLVLVYNRRTLSFESDRLRAISGIEAVLRSSFPGGFCYGLPEFFFDAALLWQPNKPMKRREMALDQNMTDYLPSWSWAGWHGSIDPKTVLFGMDYLHSSPTLTIHTTFTVSQLVTWTQIDLHGNRHTLQPQHTHFRQIASSPDHPLPPGWTLHQDPTTSQTHYYTHPAAHPHKFRYPIPIASGQTSPPNLPFPPYLTFTSTRATLTISSPLPSLDLCACLSVSLHVPTSPPLWAGMLRLNTPKSSIVPEGQACELVALSLGRVENASDESGFLEEWGHVEQQKSGAFYEFYNVVWVGREEGGWIVRRAVGRVERGVWERVRGEQEEFRMR
ncbi:hypothetical protein EJ04DRAFT_603974 [Polyplosphaeria fusca]|uniref:Heterokaryon incompatibility domain-containing protein n=1 Tax=Polyplosphaeria fusca TaxID=682080 RepID=A0A9P4V101_9PLEO|nr:hypothetical protein EJ04DRAFT_603974 [Polyplosphaeria fusca]